VKPLERLGEHVVDQDQITAGFEHDPARAERAVRNARLRVQRPERGEHLQQESERDIDARRSFLARVLRAHFDQVRQPFAGDELRHDRQVSCLIALDGVQPRETRVDNGGAFDDAASQYGLEGEKLRPQHEAFERRPRLAIESQQAAAEPVLVSGGG